MTTHTLISHDMHLQSNQTEYEGRKGRGSLTQETAVTAVVRPREQLQDLRGEGAVVHSTGPAVRALTKEQ